MRNESNEPTDDDVSPCTSQWSPHVLHTWGAFDVQKAKVILTHECVLNAGHNWKRVIGGPQLTLL